MHFWASFTPFTYSSVPFIFCFLFSSAPLFCFIYRKKESYLFVGISPPFLNIYSHFSCAFHNPSFLISFISSPFLLFFLRHLYKTNSDCWITRCNIILLQCILIPFVSFYLFPIFLCTFSLSLSCLNVSFLILWQAIQLF